jgi:hypothetical protein
MSRDPARTGRRLIVVCTADRSGRYEWMPPPRADDLIIALDGVAHHDLASRQPLMLDELVSWEERSAAEHRCAEMLGAIREHPAVLAIEHRGYPLIDFADLRTQEELARLLRGWMIARASAGSSQVVCGPGATPALRMGVLAGLRLDPSQVSYAIPPAMPGSRTMRALARPLMRAIAAGSKPGRVRIAAVVASKLLLALASLPSDELHAAGVGAMPFPALDHGNGALLALRRRLPLLATYGTRGAGAGPDVQLPARLGLTEEPELDRVATLLVHRLLSGAASELEQAIHALDGLRGADDLRALILPCASFGASRLLIGWARQRGLRIGVMQHGIYSIRDVEYGERLSDVVFGWGAGTAEQASCWPLPRPRVLAVGLPGLARPPVRQASRSGDPSPRRVLVATTSPGERSLSTTMFCETFIESIAPGLRRLVAAGTEVELRPHPAERPAWYRQLLEAHGLDIKIVSAGVFSTMAAQADMLISSTSSVAFEAAALGLPVLMWMGGAPDWVRQEHLLPPWNESAPGMFNSTSEFDDLVSGLLLQPDGVLESARSLERRLAQFASPFQPDRFAQALRSLAA